MADSSTRRLRMGFGWLSLLVVSLSFLGIGVFGFGEGLMNRVGVLMICAPIAVASMLLGPMHGLACGLIAGIALSVHDTYQPSSYIGVVGNAAPVYLLSFTLFGLLLDLLLRRLLHEGRRKVNRVVRLGIVALVSVVLTLLVYTFGNICADVMFTSLSLDLELVFESFFLLLVIEGPAPVALEVLVNAAIVLVALLAADGPLRSLFLPASPLPVSAQFRTRLFASLVLALFAVSAIAYVSITSRCERDATDDTQTTMDLYAAYMQGIWTECRQSLEEQGESPSVAQIREQVRQSELATVLFEEYHELDYGRLFAFDNQGGLLVQSDPGYMDDVDDPNYRATLVEYLEGLDITDSDALTRSASGTSLADGALSTPVSYLGTVATDDIYVLAMVPASAVFATRTTTLQWLTTMAAVLLLTLYVIAARIMDATVATPIKAIGQSMALISGGDLNERVEVWSSPEFSALSDGINAGVDALKNYAAESVQRIEQDLLTAKAIQEGALPRQFPHMDEYELYASMQAAKEVGGDFYDFFPLGKDALGFLIADVSDKGIPAALFMMRAMTEIRSCMQRVPDLGQAITMANEHLFATNPELLFVTVWAASLDCTTGALTYVNAGHNPPLLRHDGTWRWLDEGGSFVMAALGGMDYQSNSLVLEKGDALLLYTDGINEAHNAAEELYGNDRLQAFVQEHADLSPHALNDGLLEDVISWSEGTEQSDDMTLLVLEYHGPC